MIRLIQIVPKPGVRLFGKLVKKESDYRGKGTFCRSGKKTKEKAKWSHRKYKGWIVLERTAGEVVTVKLQSKSHAKDEWQLLHAFIGFVDRYFSRNIAAINIQYHG